jgi:Na+/H+ antiporter NhaA
MKEIIFYSIVAIAFLAILAYSLHMFVGGMVSSDAEESIITVGTLVGAIIVGLLARDVMRTRKKNRAKSGDMR